MSDGLTLRLDGEQFRQLVEAVAERVLDRVAEREDGANGWPEWMPLDNAAAYLGQSVAATRKLYERRKVPVYQDGPGAKVWLRRSELDAYMEANRG
jgi:excisionase family DNA binding protein